MKQFALFDSEHDVLPIITEVELIYKCKVKQTTLPLIAKSEDAVKIFRKLWNIEQIEHREESRLLLLNRANRVLGTILISQGGIAGTVIDPKFVFQAALKANASAIMLCHNHPSGNLTPSKSDIRLTKQIRECGKYLELPLLDHIIITADNYYSMADNRDF